MLINKLTKVCLTLATISIGIFGYPKNSYAASVLLTNQALPTTNLNLPSPNPNRSNVVWLFVDDVTPSTKFLVAGDSFSIGNTGESYVINEFKTWIAAPGGSFGSTLGDQYQNINLFGGLSTDSQLSIRSTSLFNTGTNNPNNGNIIVNPITYNNGSPYVTLSGQNWQLYEITFTNLNWFIDGGQEYYFGVWGKGRQNIGVTIPPPPGTTVPTPLPWINHASNKDLSGSPQQESDNKFIILTIAFDGSGNLVGAEFNKFWDSKRVTEGGNGGWDKSSDLNFQVFGDQITIPFEMRPEIGLLILGSWLTIKKLKKNAKIK